MKTAIHASVAAPCVAVATLAALCGVLLAPAPAQAALGGDIDSVHRDHAAIHATDVVTTTQHYDVHDGFAASGERIREYVDRGGKVFALSWQGPRSPDVSSLLGAYAPRYLASVRAHHGGHHVLVIAEPDLSVSILRLPRGWQGHASLPRALPPGVSGAEIR